MMDGMPSINHMSFDEGSMNEVESIQFTSIGTPQSIPSFEIMNNSFNSLRMVLPDDDSSKIADEFVYHLPTAIRNQVTIETDPILSHQIASVRNRTEFKCF